MTYHPIPDLTICSVKGCNSYTEVLVQKRFGEERVTFGYCAFHGVISATFFHTSNRKEIRV